MKLKSFATFLLLALVSAPAFAQPSPTKLHVDVLFVNDVVYPVTERSGWESIEIPAGYEITIAGWMFNCYTGQQPAWAVVYDNGFRNEVPYRFAPRIHRPDVQAAARDICVNAPEWALHLPSGQYLGFGIVIGPLTPGQHTLMLRVTDPVAWPTTDSLFGTQYRTISVRVVE